MEKKRGKGETVAGPLAALMKLLLSELTAGRLPIGWRRGGTAANQRGAELSHPARLYPLADDLRQSHHRAGTVIQPAACVMWCPRAAPDGDSLQREQLKTGSPPWARLPIRPSAFTSKGPTDWRAEEELAALRWEDVDFQWRSMKIRDKSRVRASSR
jgi:hypothetical protein